ncbi:glycoside hydrolase superfamily [Xylogone sp. PMI_703]|nr:glycoside hydrolase superfamily [Xylogone sp. PMI_703]
MQATSIIPIAFLIEITDPLFNIANAGNNCTVFSGSQLLNCPQLAEDIPICQALGKTIMLSVGGATYTEGGFPSSSEAVTAADNIWEIFGPKVAGSTTLRPFGNADIDGFDFDFESTVQNMVPFANQLRSLMDNATATSGKQYYLSAAPQCPYPDLADESMLNNGTFFDFIYVQFYNNGCGLNSFANGVSTQNNYDFSTWDNWARTVSTNKKVKVFIGAPGNVGAAGAGYISAAALGSIISYSKGFSSFGGIMLWDMSQVYSNPGFLDTVKSELINNNPGFSDTVKSKLNDSNPPSPTLTYTAQTTSIIEQPTTLSVITITMPTTTDAASSVAQWGQCGGVCYTGSTTCASPFSCIEISEWWSQCE